MILRTLKSNSSVNLILFPLFGIILWMKSILIPIRYDFFLGENKNSLFAPISKITDGFDLIKVLLSLLLVIFIAFLIQQANDRYLLIRTRTKLPATIFVIIIGGFTEIHTLHPVYFAAVFLLLAIHSFFSVFNNPSTYPGIFNSGLILGIGALFYFNLLIVVPAFLIGIFILIREARWREFVILLLGLLVPFIFAISFAFYTNNLLEFFYTIERNIMTPVNHFRSNFVLQGFLGLLIIFTVLSSIKILQEYDTRKVSTRKYYSIFLFIFVFTIAGFILVPAISQEMLVLSAVPVTFLMSNFFVSINSRFWGEFLFTLLLLSVIFMQFSDYLLNG
ncbi:MAG: DUF6427 family protein [Draconibacterium sp.]